jgi:hypothetical protein
MTVGFAESRAPRQEPGIRRCVRNVLGMVRWSLRRRLPGTDGRFMPYAATSLAQLLFDQSNSLSPDGAVAAGW